MAVGDKWTMSAEIFEDIFKSPEQEAIELFEGFCELMGQTYIHPVARYRTFSHSTDNIEKLGYRIAVPDTEKESKDFDFALVDKNVGARCNADSFIKTVKFDREDE